MLRPPHPPAERAEPTAAPGPYFTRFVEGRRGEILDAALAVFAEKGYEAGTVRDIATKVGVTEPALYRHFPSKEALLMEVVATAGEHIMDQAQQRIAEMDASDPRAALTTLLELRRSTGGDNKHVMRIVMGAAPHNKLMRGEFQRHFSRPLIRMVRDFIPRVDAALGISRTPKETDNVVRAFMSLFTGYFMTSMFFDAPPDDEAIVDAMLAIMGWKPAA